MKAFVFESFDAPAALREDYPEPTPEDDELVVRVHASSVNPVDVFTAAGVLKEMVEHEFPITLGRDFAGVVERVGTGVGRYRAGDEVFGFLVHANPTVHAGSWAELITVPEDVSVAAKPRRLDFARSGAAPLAAITSLAAFDALAPYGTPIRTASTPSSTSCRGHPTAHFSPRAAGSPHHSAPRARAPDAST